MRRIALIGGAGLMGRVTARDLVESGCEVTIGDIDHDAAAALAQTLGPRARAVRTDAGDVASVLAAIRDADAVVNVSQYYFNLTVMEACLEARVSYADLGGLFHLTKRQLELGGRFRDRGITAILGIGSCVGVTNLMAAYIAARLAKVEYLRCWDAYAPAETGIAWAYSIDTIFDEITGRPMVWRDGRMLELEPLSEPEPFLFGHGIGLLECHHSLHSEAATLPFAWPEKEVGEVFFKIASFGFAPEALARLRFLADIGMASREPLRVPTADGGAAAVRPREVLVRAMRDALARTPTPAAAEPVEPVRDVEEVVTTGAGIAPDGRRLEFRVGTAAWYHEAWGHAAGGILTGVPPSIAGQWLAEGRAHGPGAMGPELALDHEAFFAELARRGMKTTVAVTETIGG